jgi:ferredoxin-type protein NapH
MEPSMIRGFTAGAVFVVVGLGLVFNTGLGTLSSFGYNQIAAICPLGSLEVLFGTWMLVPRAILGLLGVIFLVIFVGKAFCSWLCPVQHIQAFFKTKKTKLQEQNERTEAGEFALNNWKNDIDVKHPKVALDTRHAVLAGALISTAVFGFPVFCLVCPVGLSFATFITLWRFIQFNEPSWGLLMFPVIIIIEVVLLRKWCTSLCPIGALLSLISVFNKTFKPQVDKDLCLRDTNGSLCKVCNTVCPEQTDPHSNKGKRPIHECVKCAKCSTACPVNAITFSPAKRKEN